MPLERWVELLHHHADTDMRPRIAQLRRTLLNAASPPIPQRSFYRAIRDRIFLDRGAPYEAMTYFNQIVGISQGSRTVADLAQHIAMLAAKYEAARVRESMALKRMPVLSIYFITKIFHSKLAPATQSRVLPVDQFRRTDNSNNLFDAYVHHCASMEGGAPLQPQPATAAAIEPMTSQLI